MTLVLMLAPVAPAFAQACTAPLPGSCTAPTFARVVIPRVVELTLSGGTTTLASPGEAAFDAGFAASTGPVATIRANGPWMLLISVAAPVWTATSVGPTSPARPDKPAGDLMWGTDAAGPFTAVSTTAATLGSGAATAGTSVPLFYRTIYSWTLDRPGDYALAVTLTLSAP
jgi:hypothetical protein